MADKEAAAGKDSSLGNLKMVWHHALRYPGKIVFASIALLVAAAATLAIPDGFRRVIDQGFGRPGEDIANHFYYLLGVVIVLAAATATRFYFVSLLGERVVADIRNAVHRNLLRMEPRFFEENRPSEIASRMTSDTSVIEMVVGGTVSVALRNVVMAVGGIIYLFALSPKLTGALLLGIPLVIVPITVLGRRVRDISRRSQDRIADVGAMVAETLGAMKIVQAFGQEEREAGRFGSAVEDAFGTARSRIRIRAVMTAVVISLLFSAVTLVMWQAAVDVAEGRLTGGTVAAFVITGGIVAGALGVLTEVYGELLRGAGAAGRLNELLAQIPQIKAPVAPVRLPERAQGRLRFEGVTFHYPTRRDTSALEEFNLEVKPGESLALVGPSGAGKTTIFQLVQRFYDPDAGAVLMDGIELRQADPADIRARIAFVPQETVIFAASARDNLRYGMWDATDEQLWEAAAAANAAEFLRRLPEGLDSFLGEGGARLSGGQRQRMAIARALLRDAPLLLLDEATSALDAESERLVQASLERLMEGRTTIAIAHRLATVRKVDRIVVMDHGRIVEEGTHETLQARGGLYAKLARLQFDGLAA
jgi:ATP-binding cassette, subfamily B, bacterial